MKEITGTIYICEKCNKFTSINKFQMTSHEKDCEANQLKSEKNLDKIDIYNCLDLEELNSKIINFILKYNMEFPENYEYISIHINNNSFYFEIDKSIRGVFDYSKFLLNLKLKDYFNNKKIEDFYKELDTYKDYSNLYLILTQLLSEKKIIEDNINANTLKLKNIELEYVLNDIIKQNKELK